MPTFGKGLDLRRAAEEAFEVKDVLNSTLDSEALKHTLCRQAKNQVGTHQSPAPTPPGLLSQGTASTHLPPWPSQAWGSSDHY